MLNDFKMLETKLGTWECVVCGSVATMDRAVYLDLLQTGGNGIGQSTTSIGKARVNGDGTAFCTKCINKSYKDRKALKRGLSC